MIIVSMHMRNCIMLCTAVLVFSLSLWELMWRSCKLLQGAENPEQTIQHSLSVCNPRVNSRKWSSRTNFATRQRCDELLVATSQCSLCALTEATSRHQSIRRSWRFVTWIKVRPNMRSFSNSSRDVRFASGAQDHRDCQCYYTNPRTYPPSSSQPDNFKFS